MLETASLLVERYANHLAVLLTLIAVGVAGSIVMPLFRKPLDVKGKHCYVTGGSAGLGKALAVILVKRGAHITIVARDKGRLKAVEDELRALAHPGQMIQSVPADLMQSTTSSEALDTASQAFGGRVPDHIYLCAGFSRPKFMLDSSENDFKDVRRWSAIGAGPKLMYRDSMGHTGFQRGQLGYVPYPILVIEAAVQRMAAQKVHGKVVFVSSLLGYCSFAGYTNYSPGKYALRGLADALRSEMILHNISIHLFMPAGIDTPGFAEEEKEKPKVTKKIEEDDTQISPEACAQALIRGIEKGYYQFSSHLIGELIRVVSKGSAPGSNLLLDALYYIIATIWRIITDYQVKGFREEVQGELNQKGFYQTK